MLVKWYKKCCKYCQIKGCDVRCKDDFPSMEGRHCPNPEGRYPECPAYKCKYYSE